MEVLKVYAIERGSNVFYSPDRTYRFRIHKKTRCFIEACLSKLVPDTDTYVSFEKICIRHKIEYCDYYVKCSYFFRNPIVENITVFDIHFYYEPYDDCVASN